MKLIYLFIDIERISHSAKKFLAVKFLKDFFKFHFYQLFNFVFLYFVEHESIESYISMCIAHVWNYALHALRRKLFVPRYFWLIITVIVKDRTYCWTVGHSKFFKETCWETDKRLKKSENTREYEWVCDHIGCDWMKERLREKEGKMKKKK